jgi:hypothetical protein
MSNGNISMVEMAKAEQEREAMAATSVGEPKQPPTKPPLSYDGHPIKHVARHTKGRTPPVR